MLVGLYRDGATRQRIRKGYIVAADDPDPLVADLSGRPMTGGPQAPVVRCDPRQPGAVWLDSGPVCLYGPAPRLRAAWALAHATAALAAEVRRRGGLLLPGAYRPAASATASWLVGDVHELEVQNDVQRELCTNLLRQHTPSLIALTGRAAFGPRALGGQGSDRLSSAGDHVPTRYIHSFSARHLRRVRDALSRDEGVTRLEAMDVNPLGTPDRAFDAVAVRCIDGQTLISTTMAHALLLQALAMRARRTEREGRRIGAVPQALLDADRARAVAQGLAASFGTEGGTAARRSGPRSGDRPNGGRPPGKPDRDQGRSTGGRHTTEPAASARTPAYRACRALLVDLRPEFHALDVTFAEIAPLMLGLMLQDAHPLVARNENDMAGVWSTLRTSAADTRIADQLSDPAWLLADGIGDRAREAGPGAVAAAALGWDEWRPAATTPRQRTTPPERLPRQKQRQDKPHGAQGTQRPKAAETAPNGKGRNRKAVEDFLAVLESTAPGAHDDAAKHVREYRAAGGAADLNRDLRDIDRDRAREVRRRLRPPRHRFVETARASIGWEDVAARRAVTLARKHGTALLTADVVVAERLELTSSVGELMRTCPEGTGALLVASTVYRASSGQRAKAELLVFRTDPAPDAAASGPDAATRKEGA